MLYVRSEELKNIQLDHHCREHHPVQDADQYVNELLRRRRPLPRSPGRPDVQRPNRINDAA